MKTLRLLVIACALCFAFACSQSDHGHAHEDGTEEHSHEDGSDHALKESKAIKQEEFTVNSDSTKMDSVAVDSLKKDTHTHKDGTHHHDHDHQ